MDPPITVAIKTALGSAPIACDMEIEIGTIRAVVAVFDIKFVSVAQIIKIIIISAVGEGLSPNFDTIVLAIKSPVPVSFKADASARDPTYKRIVFMSIDFIASDDEITLVTTRTRAPIQAETKVLFLFSFQIPWQVQ